MIHRHIFQVLFLAPRPVTGFVCQHGVGRFLIVASGGNVYFQLFDRSDSYCDTRRQLSEGIGRKSRIADTFHSQRGGKGHLAPSETSARAGECFVSPHPYSAFSDLGCNSGQRCGRHLETIAGSAVADAGADGDSESGDVPQFGSKSGPVLRFGRIQVQNLRFPLFVIQVLVEQVAEKVAAQRRTYHSRFYAAPVSSPYHIAALIIGRQITEDILAALIVRLQ